MAGMASRADLAARRRSSWRSVMSSAASFRRRLSEGQSGWRPQAAAFLGAAGIYLVDVKEAMKGFMRPAEGKANLVVSVTASAPVSTVDVQSVAVNALSQKGLAVNTGSYFMSIYPQIAVFVDARPGDVQAG